MISQITNENSLYSNVGANHLKKLKLSMDELLRLMSSDSVFADELMVFALSHTYQCHTVIFTHNACWTTIGTDEPIKGHQLLEICQVHLIYIGIHMFAELKRQPFIPITSTAIMEPPSSIPPCITNLDSPSSTNCVINLSTKPAKSGKSDNDHRSINENQGSTQTTSTSPSASIHDPQSDRDTPKAISDALSENLFTGKPIVYQNINETANKTTPIPGINTELPIRSVTPPQCSDDTCDSTDSNPSVAKSTNTAPRTTSESSTNISLEQEQYETPVKFDPYIDASLSGTLERIHVDECLFSPAINLNSKPSVHQDISLMDHNYSNLLNGTNNLTNPMTTKWTIHPNERIYLQHNDVNKEASPDKDNYANQINDIETEIVYGTY